MVQEFLNLRDSLHKGEFRFDLEPELWKVNYLERPGVEEDGIIKIYRQGELKGYAICSLSELKPDVKRYQVLELCATERDVMNELITRVIADGKEREADFIMLAQCDDLFEDLLAKNEFIDFTGFTVMVTLLNPKELLRAVSAEGITGRILNLEIDRFRPISLVIGEKAIRVIEDRLKADITLSMSDRVFVNILFGRTSFFREFLKGKIRVKNKIHLNVAIRFFNSIRQKKLYMPTGDTM